MDKALLDEVIEQMISIEDMIRWGISELNQADVFFGHGNDNAMDEAIALVLAVIQIDYNQLEQFRRARLTKTEKEHIAALIHRRIAQRLPAAYLTNQAWFAGLLFYVDENVLVPRSPFAEMLDKKFQPYLDIEPQMILDLCTGSGCIGIATAYQFPEAQVDCVDISAEALSVADTNIQQHYLSDRVFPIHSDCFDGVKGQQYDLIVSNPPYVDAEDMASLPDEFKHEPEIGLASGDDGLELTRKILSEAADHLTDNGWLFIEIGNSMVHVEDVFPGVPFEWVQLEHGGHGIFAFNKASLIRYKKQLTGK